MGRITQILRNLSRHEVGQVDQQVTEVSGKLNVDAPESGGWCKGELKPDDPGYKPCDTGGSYLKMDAALAGRFVGLQTRTELTAPDLVEKMIEIYEKILDAGRDGKDVVIHDQDGKTEWLTTPKRLRTYEKG